MLVLGHVATYWDLECALNAAELRLLVQGNFDWQEGWEFLFDDSAEQDPRVAD